MNSGMIEHPQENRIGTRQQSAKERQENRNMADTLSIEGKKPRGEREKGEVERCSDVERTGFITPRSNRRKTNFPPYFPDKMGLKGDPEHRGGMAHHPVVPVPSCGNANDLSGNPMISHATQ